MKTTAAQLANVNKTALTHANGQLLEVYLVNYNALEQAVNWVGRYTFVIIDTDTVKTLR